MHLKETFRTQSNPVKPSTDNFRLYIKEHIAAGVATNHRIETQIYSQTQI